MWLNARDAHGSGVESGRQQLTTARGVEIFPLIAQLRIPCDRTPPSFRGVWLTTRRLRAPPTFGGSVRISTRSTEGRLT